MFIPNYTLRAAVRRWLFNLHDIITYASHHPYFMLKKRAQSETADYITSHMADAISSPSSREIMDIALAKAAVTEGYYLEFGVYKGGSISYMAKKCRKTVIHGFDSFEGLPTDWHGTLMKKGAFGRFKKLPKVPTNVTLHPGRFEDILPDWLERHPGPVAFIHIDCDLYTSTKAVLDALAPRIGKGTVVLFDEYFNYPNWKNHEFKAFQEYIAGSNKSYRYLAYSYFQVALQIL